MDEENSPRVRRGKQEVIFMTLIEELATGEDFCSGIYDSGDIEKLLQNPRSEFIEAIRNNDGAACLLKTAEIHGHFCPGSALGVMASLYGFSLLGDEILGSDGIMEDLLAIVEVNACFADGIQAVSGCTLGNNSLIYRDFGKHAVTFAVRGREEGIRIKVRPEFKNFIEDAVPEFYPMMEKVIMKREGGPSELKKFRQKGREAAFAIIKKPFEDLFEAKTVIPDIPDYAPITGTAICPTCGEQVMATKIWKTGLHKGKCLMCIGKYFEVEGSGIRKKDVRPKNKSKEPGAGSNL
jgi:formylmethanofuran dehydrogenase subunit E